MPKRQRRSGFGSWLINMVIERQLNGQVEQTFAPEGLQTRLVVPLTHERSRGGGRHHAGPAVGWAKPVPRKWYAVPVGTAPM